MAGVASASFLVSVVVIFGTMTIVPTSAEAPASRFVPADGTAVSLTIEAPGWHTLTASGTYVYNGRGDTADADFAFSSEHGACYEHTYVTNVLDLMIDGESPWAHACDPMLSSYSVPYYCAEGKCGVVLQIFDTRYDDNRGGLLVTARQLECVETVIVMPRACVRVGGEGAISRFVSASGDVVEATLPSEWWYAVTAKGTYIYNDEGAYADADYAFGGSVGSCFEHTYVEHVLDLMINGESPWTDACDEEGHTYSVPFHCADAPCSISLQVFDTRYDDNEGGLNVLIQRQPCSGVRFASAEACIANATLPL